MILNRIGVLSVARMLGALYAGIGLILGVFFSLASALGGLAASMAANTEEAAGALIAILFGVGAIIFVPVMYGMMGFLAGALMASFYNLLAGVFGGIELSFVNQPAAGAPPAAPAQAP